MWLRAFAPASRFLLSGKKSKIARERERETQMFGFLWLFQRACTPHTKVGYTSSCCWDVAFVSTELQPQFWKAPHNFSFPNLPLTNTKAFLSRACVRFFFSFLFFCFFFSFLQTDQSTFPLLAVRSSKSLAILVHQRFDFDFLFFKIPCKRGLTWKSRAEWWMSICLGLNWK